MTGPEGESSEAPDSDSTQATGRRTVGSSGRYVLAGLLGRGGMAEVHRAHDRVLGRDVAVKLLRDRAPDPIDRARFLEEARTLALLNHANLVTILDAGISAEHPFLVLELVVGSSLSGVLTEHGQGLPPDRVAHLGAQIASALAHCHDHGVVHRDVKPGNILVGAEDRALLTDFGISRLLDSSLHHTQTGFTIGTAGYLAPEQVRGDVVTPAVDLYALGLVLLEATTGRREYTGTPVEAAVARLHRPPQIPAGLPAALSGILTALLQTDPALRPTAAEAARALTTGWSSAATEGFELSAAVPARRRLPALSGGLAATAVALALVLVHHGLTGGPSEAPAGTTSGPEKPAAATTSPSPRATPRADASSAAATVRPTTVAAATRPRGRGTAVHRPGAPRAAAATQKKPTKAKSHVAAKPAKANKAHGPGKAKHGGKGT
ncbi:MAG: serine/threonine protein kinase [Marmoricola sp.]|nr:serine/threonine protein kinase [Marmoricola sp.]